jgi:pimeloyl-ACP methyl ester carboxylesterase/DNA-binding CsgD family transcriptional regulator
MLCSTAILWDEAMRTPQTRYAKSGAVRIAYQVVGQGPLDLVFVPGFLSNLEVHWEDEGFCHLLNRLATFTRLILLDKRGTGLSDRVDAGALPSLETRMDDVRAVMDAAGSGRAALLGASEGAPMSMLFAATYPERTRALVLYGGYAHFHTWVMGEEALAKFMQHAETAWGSGATVTSFAPDRADDARFRAWWARFERLSASPTAAIALARMNAQIDVRHVLPGIRVPTLVLHRKNDARVKFAAGRYLADRIAHARFVEVPGRDHPIWTGDIDSVVDEIEQFLTGARAAPAHNRVLATIVMARLVTPERLAIRLGDRRWGERMQAWQTAIDDACLRHGGQRFGGTSSIAARFDGSVRAVRCALALREAARALELDLAVGIHVGEVELHQAAVAGLAVHITERIAARADAGEVLVSGLVKDLVAGSGLHFAERRAETIDGLEGPLRLLAVVPEQHLEPVARMPAMPNLDTLSAREHEVLKLIAQGLSNAAIAERLHLSDHTVKRHVANILLKLDLPTRAAAAALVGRQLSP